VINIYFFGGDIFWFKYAAIRDGVFIGKLDELLDCSFCPNVDSLCAFNSAFFACCLSNSA
jgi:hypothetical protein